MAYIKQNSKSVNGTMKYYNYSLVSTHFGIPKFSLQTTDKRIANRFKHKVNELEKQSKFYPDAKDWTYEVYKVCGREDLLPDYNTLIPTISEGFKELIDTKQMYGTITSQSTIDCYLLASRLMIEILNDLKVNQIVKSHKVKIESYLHRNYDNKNTINIRVRNMMQFLNWCVDMEYIDKLPFKIPQIKVEQKTKTWIPPEVFNTILDAMDDDKPEYKAYCEVAYHTGLRLRELNTNPSDKAYRRLNHTLKRVQTNGVKYYQIKVRGKGGKVEKIILPDELKPAYDKMISVRHHPCTYSKKFKDACIKVGQPHLRFHDIRHSFCQNQSLETTDALLLQLKMRHSSLSTTQNYLNDTQLKWTKQVESLKVIA